MIRACGVRRGNPDISLPKRSRALVAGTFGLDCQADRIAYPMAAGKDRQLYAALLYGAKPAGRSLRRRCRSRFDSDMPHQFSVDTCVTHNTQRTVGWVLGSPETKPLKRHAVIAVVTVNQEAVFSVWQPGKTGFYARVWRRTILK